VIKWLARPADYLSVWQEMQAYTNLRGADTPDEIWLCEHAPVYTLGQAGLPQHVLNPGDIPIVRCDRGGQVTYHGPGQVMAYALFDLRRADMYVKEYVNLLEGAVIDTLTQLGVANACRKPGAPGVYVPDPDGGELAKIAALGIKVTRHCTYHGVALNVAMDLEPFSRINPCGYAGLPTVDLSTIGARTTWDEAAAVLGQQLCTRLAP
jgi:lipoyl(octanoyl) transferase